MSACKPPAIPEHPLNISLILVNPVHLLNKLLGNGVSSFVTILVQLQNILPLLVNLDDTLDKIDFTKFKFILLHFQNVSLIFVTPERFKLLPVGIEVKLMQFWNVLVIEPENVNLPVILTKLVHSLNA